jgi:hypothetical protein
MEYKVGKEEFEFVSEAISESDSTGLPVMSGSKVIHSPKGFKIMKNPLFGFGKKPAAKSGFEIAEEVFQSHNGQVDFETFWKEFSPSQPGMRISEGRSIHADLSKQNWRFMKNGSGKKCNYRVIGKDERVLYDGQDFNKASDLMMKAQAPVRMLRDGVEISKRRPAGDVRRNGMTALRPRNFKEDRRYMVYVGNIGRVHNGIDKHEAIAEYEDYVRESKSKTGRASGEEVTLFENGEILAGYKPTSTSIKRNGMTASRHMPDGSKRDTYSVNCGNKSYHTEDLADAKKKFKSWCRTGDCTLHHGRKLLDSNFEQKSPGMALFPRGLMNNPRDLTAAHKKILKAYIEGGGVACDYESLPSTVRKKLESTGYHETLESDCDRFLWDNNNPHMKRSKIWGNPRKNYEVVVGNIGTVYSGNSLREASRCFSEYVKQSKSPFGRASSEDVTMFCDSEICKSYDAPELPRFVRGRK